MQQVRGFRRLNPAAMAKSGLDGVAELSGVQPDRRMQFLLKTVFRSMPS